MASSLALNLFALAALVPAAMAPLRCNARRDARLWAAIALSVAGTGVWAAALVSESWQTGLGATLWISIFASTAMFAILTAITKAGWRLSPLLMPYLLLLGLLASAVHGASGHLTGAVPAVWIDLHIVVSVLTYGLLTLAAVASLAVFLQERALKRKQPTRLTRMLPAVVEAESLAGRLLVASEVVLGLGLVSGMATQYFVSGALMRLDHKALLSLLAFILIGALLLGHRICGVRGRLAARVVLVAYLLVTLAYPGVKFVTQVLLSGG